jgi:hypothetical protein
METIDRPIEGRIYISGVFSTIKRSKCGQVGWLDNDPHFWTSPPTWGICRSDLRRVINQGDYVFFVLPKASNLPQMVYGFIKVNEIISHFQAHARPELRNKRMGNKNPNGNIIVDQKGLYNRYDRGVHRDKFERIKDYYIVGDMSESAFFTEAKIKALAPEFLTMLNQLFCTHADSVFGVLGRAGRKMSEEQVKTLLVWFRI